METKIVLAHNVATFNDDDIMCVGVKAKFKKWQSFDSILIT
jgi:hypothetical protein